MSLYPGLPSTSPSAPIGLPTQVAEPLGPLITSIEPQLGSDKDLRRIDRYLATLFSDVARRHGGNPHFRPLLDRLGQFVLQGGKRVRPRLCLSSYRIASGGRSPSRAIWLASASLELLHAFMLAHDDLIDGSLMRRREPTLHERFRRDHGDGPAARKRGEDLALIGGDILFALALHLLSRSGLDELILARAQRLVSEMLLETGIGEALDVLYDDRPLRSLEESHLIEAYTLKTARYSISGPLVLGAILAGSSPSLIRALDQLGDRLGLAYQIQNDLDGLEGDPEIDDFPDIDGGKRTYVLWLTHRRLNDAGRAALDDTLASPPGLERRRRLIALIRGCGALTECHQRVQSLRAEALDLLATAPLEPSQRRSYMMLISMFGLQGKSPIHVSRA